MTQATTPVAGRRDDGGCGPVNLDMREPTIDTLGVLETAALLRELTAGLIAVDDFDEALTELVRIARDAVPGVLWCGFTALRAGEPAGVAASDPRLAELDDLRPRRGLPGDERDPPPRDDPRRGPDRRGPVAGLDRPRPTARRRRGDLRPGGRRRAGDRLDQPVRRPRRRCWAPAHQLTAMLLAEHAGLLLAAVRDRARRAARAGERDAALLSEAWSGQAVGVIMTQRGCPAGGGPATCCAARRRRWTSRCGRWPSGWSPPSPAPASPDPTATACPRRLRALAARCRCLTACRPVSFLPAPRILTRPFRRTGARVAPWTGEPSRSWGGTDGEPAAGAGASRSNRCW